MTSRSRPRSIWALALAPALTAAHNFPYVPTQILMPSTCVVPSTGCDGSEVAYVFSQTDDTVTFSQLNFSATVSADVEPDVLSSALPFLDGDAATTAFAASRTANGTLLVYAGECDSGTGDIWSYSQDKDWEKRDTTSKSSSTSSRGPYFLGGAMAFSSTLSPTMDQPTLYSYGGMCATPETTSKGWQADANYTTSMLSLAPTNDESLDTGYTLSLASTAGPRTPIAGFTLTPLTPSMTNKSGVVTQQASYVLLGGHTQQAFINMSTAAVWGLPAEAWTYVSVQGPSSSDSGDDSTDLSTLGRRTVSTVESRSGHTAVLSEDGSSVIVMGGWVGSVDTAAEPQLAVLEMSETYDSWTWKIPSTQPDGDGVYGHGAAVLPGNVMMVYGGWEINSTSSSSKRSVSKRSTSPRFLNLTSMAWTTSYTNPSSVSSASSTSSPNAPNEDGHPNTLKLGLGLGLGFGLAVLIAALAILCYWRKKHRQRRYSRDQGLQALSQDAGQFLHDPDDMLEADHDAWGPDGWYVGGRDAYQGAMSERSLGYESLRGGAGRGGAFAGFPTRKPPPRAAAGAVGGGSSAGYVPASQRPGSFVAVPGRIHPIYEDEEEDAYHNHQKHQSQEVHTPVSEAPSDPFQTPTATHAPTMFPPPGSRGSATPSPEGRRHDPEVQDWVSDVDAADALLARMNTRGGQGRVSPTRRNSTRGGAALRDDESRSGSNLSESARSVTESLRGKRPNPLVPLALFSGSLRDVEHQKPGSSSSSSYNTARSSFGALQAEGPSLLMGRPYDDDEQALPPSPSKTKPRRGGGWLGSLRRVFSSSGDTTPHSSREDMSQQQPMTHHEGGDYEPGLVGLRGELLRRKQGRQDWEAAAPGESESGEPETDWDIERAVEQRLVQVMFTVPRERLRVVNADEEGDGEREDEIEELVRPQAAVLVDPEKESQGSTAGGSLRGREHGSVSEKSEMVEVRHRGGGLTEDEEEEDDDEEVQPYDEKHLYDPHLQVQPLHITPTSRTPSHGSEFLQIDTSAEPRLSHETDDTGRRSSVLSAVMLEAQAMPLTRERPRTRVLAMVDSFETLSREGSPTRSLRGSPRVGTPKRDE